MIDQITDNLPVELHLPSYQFLGPGTHVEERMARGNFGKNPLDIAARDHGLTDLKNRNRHLAQKVLSNCTFSRLLADDLEAEEKAAVLLMVYCLFD